MKVNIFTPAVILLTRIKNISVICLIAGLFVSVLSLSKYLRAQIPFIDEVFLASFTISILSIVTFASLSIIQLIFKMNREISLDEIDKYELIINSPHRLDRITKSSDIEYRGNWLLAKGDRYEIDSFSVMRIIKEHPSIHAKIESVDTSVLDQPFRSWLSVIQGLDVQ